MHPTLSLLLRATSVTLLTGTVAGCVPAKSYDDARTAAESEVTAHGRTRARLEAAHAQVNKLEEAIARREQEIARRESSLAESRLEITRAKKDQETASALVDQLRAELARTGHHLTVFSDEKRDLERALVLAEERLRAIERAEGKMAELVAATRDLTLALGDGRPDGVSIGAREGRVVLSVPASQLFAPGSDALVVDAAPLLQAVAAVSAAHPTLRITIGEPEQAPLAEERAQRLGAALRERGVVESLLVLPPRDAAAAPVPSDAAGETAPRGSPTPEAAGPNSPEPAADAAAGTATADEAAPVYEFAFSP